MGTLCGPVVVVSGPELEALGHQLSMAIEYAFTARGKFPPRVLLDFSVAVNRAAGGSAGSARNPALEGFSPSSGQLDDTLTVADAARIMECSASYVRRLIRRGDVEASREGHQGAYLVYAESLAAWIASRSRKEATHREAA
jgi:excisionase family DNA binding protein